MTYKKTILPQGPGETTACLTAMVAGIASCIGASDQVTLDSVQYTKNDLGTKVAGYLGTFTQADDAEAAFHSLVAQRVKVAPEVASFIAAFFDYLQARYRSNPATLEKFGFRAHAKAPAESTDQKAAKAAKARLTRQKNGTLGKRQKQAEERAAETPPATPPAAAPGKGSPA